MKPPATHVRVFTFVRKPETFHLFARGPRAADVVDLLAWRIPLVLREQGIDPMTLDFVGAEDFIVPAEAA